MRAMPVEVLYFLESISRRGSDDRIIVDYTISSSGSSTATLTLDAPGGVVLNSAIKLLGPSGSDNKF